MTVASEVTQTSALSPLVVSLSLTKKVPRLFCKFKRSLSESRRVIFPKYHLPKWATENEISKKLLLSVWSRKAEILFVLEGISESTVSTLYIGL